MHQRLRKSVDYFCAYHAYCFKSYSQKSFYMESLESPSKNVHRDKRFALHRGRAKREPYGFSVSLSHGSPTRATGWRELYR